MVDETPSVDQAMLEIEWLIADAAAEMKKGVYDDPDGGLPDWFMGKDEGYTQAIATVKERAKKRIAQIEVRRAGLWWHFGDKFKAQVQRDIEAQEGKTKSVHYLNGTAGTRTVGAKQHVIITNQVSASLLLDKVLPHAVTYNINKAIVLAHYKETGESIDGIEIEDTAAYNSFYPKRPDKFEQPEEVSDE